jgi:hypothetical protein
LAPTLDDRYRAAAEVAEEEGQGEGAGRGWAQSLLQREEREEGFVGFALKVRGTEANRIGSATEAFPGLPQWEARREVVRSLVSGDARVEEVEDERKVDEDLKLEESR